MSSSSREDMRSACLAMAARHSDEVMGAETLAVYRSLVTR
jgi:hypothetical protein